MNKEMYDKVMACKDYKDVIAYSKEVNKRPLTEEQAKMVYDEVHKKGELTDEDLDHASGGWKFPWQDDDNPPAPKFQMNQLVKFSFYFQELSGRICEISKERKSNFGFNPEWEYKIYVGSKGMVYIQWESDLKEC